MSTLDFLTNGAAKSDTVIILAHGAGAPMDHPFMEFFAVELAKKGPRVARFEFPYMAKRRTSDKKPGPNRPPVLRETWHQAVEAFAGKKIIVGGKSMGGRIASLVADELQDKGVIGLVCLGYPFHPVGKPEKLRTEHLESIQTPTLIVQGTRDPFGVPNEVKNYKLSKAIKVEWMEDGDHGLKPRKSSGRTEQQNWEEAIAAISQFVERIDR